MFLKNLKSILVTENDTIKKCILFLVKSGAQIIFVTNKKKQLLGSITDGDLRRALLKNNSIDNKIKYIYNKNPFKCIKSTSYQNAEKIMLSNNISSLPVVDKNNKIIGFYKLSFKNLKENDNNCDFVIMAGGKGKRLRPLTLKTPKPMLKINGSPILEIIINRAKIYGYSKFFISINYLGKKIQKYFGNGLKHGCNIKYINEKKPLGTIGSVANIKKQITKKNVIVVNGDVISEINYENLLKFHISNKADATMAVYPHQMQNPYGEIVVKKLNILEIKEKPITTSYVNSGVYVFKKSALNFLKKNYHMDTVSFFNILKKKNKKIIAFALHENWKDIGLKKEYLELNKKK